MTVTTRLATPEDLPFLRRVFVSARASTFDSLPLAEPQKSALIEMQFRAREQGYERQHEALVREVILWDGAPVGTLYRCREGNRERIVDISVLAEHRNQGIGSVVLQRLAQDGPLSLSVASDNPAKRLYERLGFRQVSGADGPYLEMEL